MEPGYLSFYIAVGSGVVLAVWTVRRLRDAIRYRRGDRRVLSATPMVDEWYAASHVRDFDLVRRPPPRRGGFLAQLRTDLSSPIPPIAWGISAGMVAEGILLEMPHLSILGLAASFVFGRNFIRCVRLHRDSVISQVVAHRLTNARVGKLGQAVVPVPPELQGLSGSEAKVMVPWQLARTLLDDHGAIEMLVGFDPRNPTQNAGAIGLRAPSAEQPVGPTALPRATIAHRPR